MAGKVITDAQLLGEGGIALIEQRLIEMGHIWRPTSKLDAGIDGEIEIRDQRTGRATNLLIKVQSKAVSKFENETEDGFDYWPRPEDVEYWLSGNLPVIVVVSRPATGEAYWVPIQAYKQANPTVKRIHFNKVGNAFDRSARDNLASLAKASTVGIHIPSLPRSEIVLSNLLPIVRFPERLYLAATEHTDRKQLIEALKLKASDFGTEFVVKGKQILSVHDLGEYPYREICDRGSVEDFDAGEWAWTDDPDRYRDFVQLLNHCLRAKARQSGLRFDKDLTCYYFRASGDLKPIHFEYFAGARETRREVFGPHSYGKGKGVSFYRHSAFKGQFYRYDSAWYLEMTPTYYFSSDGWRQHRKYEEYLKKIKILEKNNAVRGQLVMWAELLARRGDMLSPEYPHLGFGAPLSFSIDVGVNDEDWLDREKNADLGDDGPNSSLFEIL